MLVASRPRPLIGSALTADAPYVERASRRESRLDGALLGAWGRISPYLLSALVRERLKRFALRVEKLEPQLTNLTDGCLLERAEALRARLPSAGL